MGLLSEIQKLIEEHGSASILRERLAFWQDRLRAAEEDNVDFQRRIAQLEEENRQLQERLADQLLGEEFTEHRGALFKRGPTGEYHECVYCPSCRKPMVAMEDFFPFDCEACQRSVQIKGGELSRVLAELRSKK